MKKLSKKINSSITSKELNFDAAAMKFEEKNGLCVVADGKENKGVLSDRWASFLCEKTSTEALRSFSGLKMFLQSIWEEFYEEIKTTTKDSFLLAAFEKQGSFSTYTAAWFRQEQNRIWYNWISYGNSAVLVYNTKKDELVIPSYNNSLIGFLKNKGLINWKEDDLNESCFLSVDERELKENEIIILASDIMAEHLVLSYFIIKSKDDNYWDNLSKLMKSDSVIADLIFKNRNAYQFSSFNDLLQTWETKINENSIAAYIDDLQNNKMIAKDDISLQVIAYDKTATELITKHKPVSIKTFPSKTAKSTVPKPISKAPAHHLQFKTRKAEYFDCILDNKITKLYHFTDIANIPSIKKLGGLFSWHYLLSNNIPINKPGGDELSRMLDARYNLQNYVRTSFCKNHPMLYFAKNEGRITHPVILEIDPTVISFKESLFSNMNATKTGHKRGGDLEDLKRIRFDICRQINHFDLSEEEKSYYQAEVMVLEFIPSKYILNLNRF